MGYPRPSLAGIGVPWVLTGTHRCALMPRVASRQSANPLLLLECGLVNVSWWSKQGQRDCTLLLLYVFCVRQQLLIHSHWNLRILTFIVLKIKLWWVCVGVCVCGLPFVGLVVCCVFFVVCCLFSASCCLFFVVCGLLILLSVVLLSVGSCVLVVVRVVINIP